MTEETNNIENHSVGGSVAVGRDITVGGRSTVRGNATFDRDVYISGWLNARNIRGAGKGLYETVDKLNSAYPNPENGWFALVGNTLPADIYRAWGGEWVATGQKGGEPVLELAKLTELSESLENEVSARVAADEALKKAIDAEVTARTNGDKELSDALTKEIADREKAIVDEVLARTTAITEAVEAEADARTKAIAAEAKARDTAISAEATARSNADTALQTAMNENVKELKGADTEHESRLLALEQSEWPLSLELSINPILIEFTGSEKDTSVAWKIMRKGVGVTPTVLTFKQDGVALSAELVANGSINAKVNKLGDTVFEIAVEAEGMKKSASKKLTMVLPVYMGFAGASDAAGLAITELSKYAPLSSPAGTYKIKNNADGIYLWLCVPDTMTINKVTSSGFTVPMREVQTGQTELGGYKCYRSSNAIVAGEYTYTIS
ncbi:hypothetical protein [Segatella copri]|uniref:hypothetical protein n=1 Tax=Segatella copri TaxID=165179 RepID=UPI0019347A3F|nr:hypothetical protein [Segatella copri]MBM0128666.1 hypothetical protein [Segatella copri]